MTSSGHVWDYTTQNFYVYTRGPRVTAAFVELSVDGSSVEFAQVTAAPSSALELNYNYPTPLGFRARDEGMTVALTTIVGPLSSPTGTYTLQTGLNEIPNLGSYLLSLGDSPGGGGLGGLYLTNASGASYTDTERHYLAYANGTSYV